MRLRSRLVLTLVLVVSPLAPAWGQPAGPFHPVVTVREDDALELALVGNTPIIRYAYDGLALATLGPRGVVRNERLASGIAHCGISTSATFSGHVPSPWWLVKDLRAWSTCPDDVAHILRWTGEAWILIAAVDAHNVLAAPFRRGSALVLEVPFYDGTPWGYTLRVVGGPEGLVPPTPTRARRGKEGVGDRDTELESANHLATGKDGSVLVVGNTCRGDNADLACYPAVEYFPPGARRGRILAAPIRVSPDTIAFFVRTPEDFWLGGAHEDKWAQLAHFDGHGWTRTSGPPGRMISFSVDDRGTIWSLSYHNERNTMWRKRVGGRWGRVPPPAGAKNVKALIVRRGGDAWLVAERGVYSTLPVREVLAWKDHPCTDAERERVEREEERVHAMPPLGGGTGSGCIEVPIEPAPTGPPPD